MTDIVEHVEQKFRSGNSVPIDRAWLSADEWAQLRAEIVRLRGEVDDLAPQLDAMTAGYERMTAYGISHNGNLVYMSESARAAYSDVVVERDAALASIAPAEAKGGGRASDH